jgi:hypothetical protein
MFNTDWTYDQTSTNTDRTTNYCELNRLLSAAIVSTGFRNMLMTNPESAIIKGYQGEKFNLSSDEYRWLVSVQATDLASFASQMLDYQNKRTPAGDLAIAVKIPAMSRVSNGEIIEYDWPLG